MKEQPIEKSSPASSDSTLAIVAMVLGVVSLTGPGLLLGIPAIVVGIIALKKSQANRGLAITGLVTGIVSTLVSLLIFAFFVLLIVWGATAYPEGSEGYYDYPGGEPRYEDRLQQS